jgi:predicted PurR-regulated permease PerM
MLKTFVSALTAAAVGSVLWILDVRLWFVWTVLTFIFNYIPNVGSAIAMFLPLSVSQVPRAVLQSRALCTSTADCTAD